MAQHSFQMGGNRNGGASINPNNLAMSGFQSNFASHTSPNPFSNGSAFLDDELLEGLTSPTEHHGVGTQGQSQDFGAGMGDMNFEQGMYSQHSVPMDQHINHFSSTPDGGAMRSPFAQAGFGSYRQMSHSTPYTAPLQSPLSYAGSPLTNAELGNDHDAGYMNRKPRARMAQAMQRTGSSNRSPLPGKNGPAPAGLSMDANAGFGAQPIQTGGSSAHARETSQPWGAHTPNSLASFPPSSFNSPLTAGLHSAQAAQISDILLKGGASMPAKIGSQMVTPSVNTISSQEAKRKRRRESHNAVERRRRDNINERIQDLSKLVPDHRLEDEKIRKAIQNGTPLSPTLGAVASPTQATSGLAGPGLRRAAVGSMAGNITTGLPLEDRDKGPNKGDILNGAVSWMRDLMWMLHLKLQQQEELINCVTENGGTVPFEITEDELRMHSELNDTISRIDDGMSGEYFSYSRTAGSGLRVPHHTDIKGDPLNGGSSTGSIGNAPEQAVVTPEDDDIDLAVDGRDPLDSAEFFDYDEDENAAPFIGLKEEYGNMDTTQ